ncbi:MAG: GCAxxG family protein [Anaerosporomusa subterranea]|jgi:C_GCAxxG_C_C family probable redox protein|nr:GCAxxG family protein [Anaerosporomusa subterranea]
MVSSASADLKGLAGNNFRNGYNCAEAILRAFRDGLQLPLDDEALKIASGFGGGFGHAGCACGALSASIMVLGLMQGRSDSSQNRAPVYAAAQEFHRRFEEKFGATCCRMLNPYPFDTKEHLRNCLKITGGTAELLADFIAKK